MQMSKDEFMSFLSQWSRDRTELAAISGTRDFTFHVRGCIDQIDETGSTVSIMSAFNIAKINFKNCDFSYLRAEDSDFKELADATEENYADSVRIRSRDGSGVLFLVSLRQK